MITAAVAKRQQNTAENAFPWENIAAFSSFGNNSALFYTFYQWQRLGFGQVEKWVFAHN